VNITTGATEHNGVYTIMDTGPKVQGRLLDIYMWSCHEALAFGRQQVEVTVLRLGWNPGNSVPSLVDRLFRRREANRATRSPVPPAADVPPPDDGAQDTAAAGEPTSTVGNDSLAASSPSEAALPQSLQPDLPASHFATVPGAPAP
jgi:hypothetical protein